MASSLNDLLRKWKPLADRQTYDTMKQEIPIFVEEARDEGIDKKELLKRKEAIVQLWSPATWKKAQEENPHWSNKDWYEKRHSWVVSCLGRALKDVYGASEPKKPEQRPALKVVGDDFSPPSSFEEDYYKQFEVLTHEQVLKHRKKMEDRERGGGK